MAGSTFRSDLPFNIGISADQRIADSRRVDPKTGQRRNLGARASATASAATSIPALRQILVHRKTRATGSATICRATSSTMISKIGEAFRLSLFAIRANLPDTKFAMGHKCSEFTTAGGSISARMLAPLGMKVLYRRPVPRRVQEQHPDRRTRLVEPA